MCVCARVCVRAIHEKPLHAQRATVWCGFWAGGVIGPYFFENDAGNAVTVNGVRYRNMITEFFVASVGRYGYGRHVVSAGRRNLSHCLRNNGVVARKISWPCHLTQWRSELATEMVRFVTVRLLSLGAVCEISCLRQQTTNNS